MFKIKIISGYCVLNLHHNIIYAAKGYKIFKSLDRGVTWKLDGIVEDTRFALIANNSRLLTRLLRAEITDMLILQDKSRILIGKKGIFVAKTGEKIYRKTFSIPRGTRPLNLCTDNKDNLYFGEYFSNPQRDKTYIYRSIDSGITWKICYTFPRETIRHIHGIFYDQYEDLIWFATGDLDGECMIGNTNNDFKTVNIVKQGEQIFRTVQLLFYKDFIIYGTDTEYEKNYIYLINRKDNKEQCLMEIQGSVLSATNSIDGAAIIATAVEPSKVNLDSYVHIWFSSNGFQWKELCKYEKDFLSAKYFQYGRVKFPRNGILHDDFLFSGHALKGIDNKTLIYTRP